jgi:hypothetical protein
MQVPEATVNKNHLPARGKYKVRFSGEVLTVKPEAVTVAVEQSAEEQLRRGIFRPDLPHIIAASFYAQLVHADLLDS